MKRIFAIMLLGLAIMGMGVEGYCKTPANKSKAQSSQSRKGKFEKSPVVIGDFDGDGKMEKVWTEGWYDQEGCSTGVIKLCSDNPKLAGKILGNVGNTGVSLFNHGKLSKGKKDYLGYVTWGMSNWSDMKVIVYSDGQWKNALNPIDTWFGSDDDEDFYIVKPATSGRPGYVGIEYYEINEDADFIKNYREEKLKN